MKYVNVFTGAVCKNNKDGIPGWIHILSMPPTVGSVWIMTATMGLVKKGDCFILDLPRLNPMPLIEREACGGSRGSSHQRTVWDAVRYGGSKVGERLTLSERVFENAACIALADDAVDVCRHVMEHQRASAKRAQICNCSCRDFGEAHMPHGPPVPGYTWHDVGCPARNVLDPNNPESDQTESDDPDTEPCIRDPYVRHRVERAKKHGAGRIERGDSAGLVVERRIFKADKGTEKPCSPEADIGWYPHDEGVM